MRRTSAAGNARSGNGESSSAWQYRWQRAGCSLAESDLLKASSSISTNNSVLSSAGVISPVVVFLSHNCHAFRFMRDSTYIAVTSRLSGYFSYNGAIASANAALSSGVFPMFNTLGSAPSLASLECLNDRARIRSISNSVQLSIVESAC